MARICGRSSDRAERDQKRAAVPSPSKLSSTFFEEYDGPNAGPVSSNANGNAVVATVILEGPLPSPAVSLKWVWGLGVNGRATSALVLCPARLAVVPRDGFPRPTRSPLRGLRGKGRRRRATCSPARASSKTAAREVFDWIGYCKNVALCQYGDESHACAKILRTPARAGR